MKNQSNTFDRLEQFIADNPNFQDSPFFVGLCDGDNSFDLVMEGKESRMNREVWNLIVTRKDLGLYQKHKLIPTRGWKIGDVKRHFGLEGNINTLMPKFQELCKIVIGKDMEA